jgi:tryptophan synthase beta chain
LELGGKIEKVQKVFKEAKEKFNPSRESRMIKVELPEDELPKAWYNINADLHKCGMKVPFPTGPGLAVLPQIFPPSLISQELAHDCWIAIPDELIEIYRIWRPTPLYRARKLEEYLKTPARIYYKNEYVSPPGSHKPNTAVAQAYFNMKDGFEGVATETGAGQWGSGLCFGAALAGIKCDVFMVRVSYYQKPGRRVMMESWGGRVVPSPSVPPERIYEDMTTETAKKALAEDPNHPGSLGWAIAEAIEHALKKPYPLNYALGSVLNHVLMHQTIVGLECYKQYELIDEYPDVMFGCTGGGSNHSGAIFPFMRDKLDGRKPETRFVACEALSCPRLTRPKYVGYDLGDSVGFTPMIWMYTLGHDFVPAPIHAGGLRYHGMAPQLCALVHTGFHEVEAFPQTEIFEAGQIVSTTEGLLIAPETLHCWAGAIREARRCAETGEEKVIHVANSGHGWVDVKGYDEYLKGKLEVLL